MEFSDEALREARALLDCPVCEEPVTSMNGLNVIWGIEPNYPDQWFVQELTSSQVAAGVSWLHRHQPGNDPK